MAFYKDFDRKSRQEKREDAFRKGGFEDEGSKYRGQNTSRKPKVGYDSQPEYKDKHYHSNKVNYGNRPDRGGKTNYSDRSEINGKYGYGSKTGYNDYSGFKNKPGYSAKPGYGTRSGYEDRPKYSKQSDFEDRSNRNGKGSSYGKKTRYDRKPGYDRKPESISKPHFEREKTVFSPKPGFHEKPGFDTFHYTAPSIPAHYDHEEEAIPNENLLCGRNPIREALKSGRDIEKLMVAKGDLTGSAREIIAMAKERHIPIQEVERNRLDTIAKNHQGMLAFASAYAYSTVEQMLENCKLKGEAPFLILLDGITDPHNLGAIIRSAECAGAHGVIVQERRAVGLTPAAVKASAGAIEYMPVARVTNLVSTLELLKKHNIWTYAADMDGKDYSECDFSDGVALVIGAEGEGVGRRVLDNCDETVSLPVKGHVDSLNASVAAGILMYAVMKDRR